VLLLGVCLNTLTRIRSTKGEKCFRGPDVCFLTCCYVIFDHQAINEKHGIALNGKKAVEKTKCCECVGFWVVKVGEEWCWLGRFPTNGLIIFKGKRFRYHSKSKKRFQYHSRLIKDFHTNADLVIAVPTIIPRTSSSLLLRSWPSITVTIGDEVGTWTLWARGKLQEHRLLARTNTIVMRSPL
jgi:hypothetical protein